MISKTSPGEFSSRFDVTGCFLECNGEILLLQRQDNKPEGGMWGVPAGKAGSESIQDAMAREMQQETGFTIPASRFSYFGKVFVRYPDYDFVYHIFHSTLSKKKEIRLNPGEHKEFAWVSPKNALKMNLIMDLDACIKLFYGMK